MYRKVRKRLTLLFAGVTCALLAGLLVISFAMSVTSRFSMQFSSFSRQSSDTLSEAEGRNVVTTDWILSKEQAGNFYLFLTDNEAPIFHNETQPELMRELFKSLLPVFQEDPFSPALPADFKRLEGEEDVYALYRGPLPVVLLSYSHAVRGDHFLRIFALQPLDAMARQTKRDLLLYGLLFLLSGSILAAFSWFFTGRLLRPLLDAQKSQNRFISAASHELRTPLAVILSSASACRGMPPKEQEHFFRVIEREGAQMSDMLEQLLTLSRADSHGLRLRLQQTDLQTLLLQVYEAFLPLADAKGHLLSVELPREDIPPWCCDEGLIRQICTNLLQNALAYTPAGSRILLSLALHGRWAEISVSDNGPGIPDDEKEQIFQRFQRGSSRDTEKGHHGLGLAVAREIALAHGGSLTVHDAPEGGASFLLRLPQSDPSPSPSEG